MPGGGSMPWTGLFRSCGKVCTADVSLDGDATNPPIPETRGRQRLGHRCAAVWLC